MYVGFIALMSNLHYSRTNFVEKHINQDRWFDRGFTFWDEKGISSNTTQAKIADSMKTKSVTKLKTDQMKASARGAVAETPMPVLSRKSFNKLPQWDFEDVYNQDAPPRPTVRML